MIQQDNKTEDSTQNDNTEEYTFACSDCGVIYNTHFPNKLPKYCYECSAKFPWNRKESRSNED